LEWRPALLSRGGSRRGRELIQGSNLWDGDALPACCN